MLLAFLTATPTFTRDRFLKVRFIILNKAVLLLNFNYPPERLVHTQAPFVKGSNHSSTIRPQEEQPFVPNEQPLTWLRLLQDNLPKFKHDEQVLS
jgi:hypothetical protein